VIFRRAENESPDATRESLISPAARIGPATVEISTLCPTFGQVFRGGSKKKPSRRVTDALGKICRQSAADSLTSGILRKIKF